MKIFRYKRSQGHIEMILSMVLFIGALIFIFIFINPFGRVSEGVSVIGDVEEVIIGNISMNIGKLSAVDNVNGVECSVIQDYGGNFIEIVDSSVTPPKSDFYFADFFAGDSCSEVAYTLGSFTNESMIIRHKIGELKTTYDEDYFKLKSDFNLLNDFSFIIKDIDGVEIPELTPDERKIPAGVDVEAVGIPIRVLKDDGSFEELILNIMAW